VKIVSEMTYNETLNPTIPSHQLPNLIHNV